MVTGIGQQPWENPNVTPISTELEATLDILIIPWKPFMVSFLIYFRLSPHFLLVQWGFYIFQYIFSTISANIFYDIMIMWTKISPGKTICWQTRKSELEICQTVISFLGDTPSNLGMTPIWNQPLSSSFNKLKYNVIDIST